MARKKKEISVSNIGYDPSDWGQPPAKPFRITLRMIPIILVLILGVSLGLTNVRKSNIAHQQLEERGGDYEEVLEGAYALVVQGNYNDAVRLASDVIEQDPDNALAYSILGLAHARRGLTEEAAISLRTAVELDPEFALAWHNLGVVEESRGENAAALLAYSNAHDLEPDNSTYADARERMGELVRDQSEWNWNETESERLFMEGVVALNGGTPADLDYAENIFASLLEERPYDVASRNMLGKVYARQGRIEEAEVIFTSIVEEEPGFSEAWYNLAMVHRSQGRLEAALTEFDMAYTTSSVENFRQNALEMAESVREMLESETEITPAEPEQAEGSPGTATENTTEREAGDEG